MIYVCGDTHIPIDIKKLNSRNFIEQKDLTKDDYVIILGDFGLIWDYNGWSKEELYWKRWIENKPWTTLFIDGNHENFNRLNEYPVQKWNGGKVHKISDSIIHLMRGQVFTINNQKLFTFGGAMSTDRGIATQTADRDRGRIWWDDEMPTIDEIKEARSNLKEHNNKVDYILTHTLSSYDIVCLNRYFNIDYQNAFLDDVRINVDYKHWYAGHFHIDKNISFKTTVLYNAILELGDVVK